MKETLPSCRWDQYWFLLVSLRYESSLHLYLSVHILSIRFISCCFASAAHQTHRDDVDCDGDDGADVGIVGLRANGQGAGHRSLQAAPAGPIRRAIPVVDGQEVPGDPSRKEVDHDRPIEGPGFRCHWVLEETDAPTWGGVVSLLS